MQNLLRKGQVFRCAKFKNLLGTLVQPHLKKYYVDFNKLHFDSWASKTTVYWTEYNTDGWKKDHQDTVNLAIHDDDIVNKNFVVMKVSLTGGGTGHGLHDTYPDGHHIAAKEIGGAERTVSFFQTGCFRDLIPPQDIELISGPKDKEVELKLIWEEND